MPQRRSVGDDFALESGQLLVELHKTRVPYAEARSRYAALVEEYAPKVEPELAVELRRRAAERVASYGVDTFEELADAWTRLNELGFSNLERKVSSTLIFARECHRLRRPQAAIPLVEGLIGELEAARGVARVWRKGELALARRILRLLTTGSETVPVAQRRRSESLGTDRCFIGIDGEWQLEQQRGTSVRQSPAELELSRCRWLTFHPIAVVTDDEFAELAAVESLRLRLNGLNLCGHLRLTDTGLAQLGTFPHLEVLFMQGYGRITFASIAHLRALRTLEVVDFSKKSSLPRDIARLRPLSMLKELRILNERLDDASLAELASLESLELVSVPHNPGVTDAGIAELAKLPNLSHLDVDDCARVTDASLRVLARAAALTHIRARSCSLTKRGIAEFKASRPDCRLTTARRRAISPQ